jgi:hypothetical protein
MRTLIVWMVVLLAGCVSPQVAEQARAQDYQKRMNTWVGVSEDNLIGGWGVPNASYDSNNAKYLTYVQILPTIFVSGIAFPRQCKTTFTLRDSKVMNWQSQGQCN